MSDMLEQVAIYREERIRRQQEEMVNKFRIEREKYNNKKGVINETQCVNKRKKEKNGIDRDKRPVKSYAELIKEVYYNFI